MDRRRRLLYAGLGVFGLAFAFATRFWSFRTSLILDDYLLCAADGNVGAVWRNFWELTGPYRPLTYPVTALRTLTCDVFVVHKILGFGLHLAAGWMVYVLARRLRLSAPAAATALVAFLFSPFALEAMAWPASVYGYPLALVFLLGFALLVVWPSGRPGVASVLGLLAVVTNEQTLGLVVLLPLVAAGAWRARLRRWARVLSPTIAYTLIVGVTAAATGYERSGSFGPGGVANLVGNTGDLLGAVIRVLPPGSQWRAFQAGPGITPPLALIAAVVGVGLFLAGSRPTGRAQARPVAGALWVAVGGAVAVLALLAPIYAQEPPWLSPRYLYMPYAAFGILLGGLLEALIRAQPRLRLAVAVLPILIVALVGDGLSRDAADYRHTYEAERAIATDVAADLEAGSYEAVVLVDSPWSLAPGTPPLGEHVVQAFAVTWAAHDALEALSDTDVAVPVLIERAGSAFCDAGGGVLEVGGRGVDPSHVLVFDIGARERVSSLDLPTGQTIPLGGEGPAFAVASCT